MGIITKSIAHNRWLLLVLAPFLLFSVGMLHNAFAMGPAPGTCNNEYDGSYVNATIIAGNQTFYPLQNNVVFNMFIGQSYYITTTIHVPNQSINGNSLPGSLWYSSNEIGYDQNYCSDTVNPNTNYTISENVGFPGDYNPQQSQAISVYWAPNGYSYTVNWITPTPSAPTALEAMAVSSSQINMSWTAPTNNGVSAITGYKIERSNDTGTTWNDVVSNTGSNATAYSDTGLSPDTTYTYRVSAINSAGTGQPSNTASATTNSTVVTTSTLTINSQDSSGNTLTGFHAELYAQNGTQIANGFTPYNFTLNNGQSYTVSIDDFGKYKFNHWEDTDSINSTRPISISSNEILTAVYATAPTSPTELKATGELLRIDLSWNAPSDNGGAAITGYMIERSSDGGSTWSTLVADTGNTGTTYSDSQAHLLVTYTYRVSAINDVGTSSPSNTASASTLPTGSILGPLHQ